MTKMEFKGGSASIMKLMEQVVLPTYLRLPMVPVRGAGCWVWDADGKKYLDFFSGLAVDNLGHSHPSISRAISNQAELILHSSNLFVIPEQALLASQLVKHSGLHQAFFCNSGAEAIESAIKFARAYSIKRYGPDRYEIIVAANSFHGRTYGALSATMQEKYRQGFGPLVAGFKAVAYDRITEMTSAVTNETCAILLETIQGEGGVNIPSSDYLQKLRKLCEEKNLLLILDEVQAGMGRTGRLFAYEHFGIRPDIVVLAKALGSGVPIGACLVSQEVASQVKPGMHASTFGGNHLSCRVALETLRLLSKPAFLAAVRRKGAFFIKSLNKIKNRFPEKIREVRGLGLICAITLNWAKGPEVVGKCLEEGLLINSIQGNVLRFVPPLIIKDSEIKKGVGILESVLAKTSV